VRRKGHDVLLAALAELARPAHGGLRPRLWIAGDGEERDELEQQARSLGLGERVSFLGVRDDVGDLLAAADLCVLPSRQEGLGVAALEAMAAGRPVVASKVGGLAGAVEDGLCGLLVPPEEPAALAAALARVLGDAALSARLSAGGRARVERHYSAARMVDAYEQLYRRVIDARGCGTQRA